MRILQAVNWFGIYWFFVSNQRLKWKHDMAPIRMINGRINSILIVYRPTFNQLINTASNRWTFINSTVDRMNNLILIASFCYASSSFWVKDAELHMKCVCVCWLFWMKPNQVQVSSMCYSFSQTFRSVSQSQLVNYSFCLIDSFIHSLVDAKCLSEAIDNIFLITSIRNT